jgi:hypothetical protein
MRMAFEHNGELVIRDVPGGDIKTEPYPISTEKDANRIKAWAVEEDPNTVWVIDPANNKFRVRENL